MTLTIEIDTLRRLNDLAPRYNFDRADLIAFAELLASEIARARQDAVTSTPLPDSFYHDTIASLSLERMSFPEAQPCEPPAIEPSQPETVESKPDTKDSQPEPPDAKPESVAPSPRVRAWTDAQDDQLDHMKRAGASVEEMAKRLDRSATAVLARLQKLKTEKRGSCPLGRVWSEAEDKLLVQMQADGKSWKDIAAKLDRTVRSVQQRYGKLKRKGALDAIDTRPEPAPVVDAEKPRVQPPVTKPATDIRDTRRIQNIGDLSHLKLRQRTLVMHLANLNDDFEPIDDLDIVEGLMQGKKPSVIADELGCKPHDVAARWKAMLIDDVVNNQGNPTIDGQQDILVAARHIVKCVEGSNA